MGDPCAFCKMFDVELRAYREAGIRDVLPTVACFTPLRPTVAGHLLVVPVRHVETLAGLDEHERRDLFDRLYERGHEQGAFYVIQQNGAAAQQTVSHLHFHIVPGGRGFRIPWNESTSDADDGLVIW